MKRHTLTVLFALYIYIYSENHSSSIFVDVINTSIFPAWLLRRIWLLTRQWVALQARKALFEPITVECPCCDKPFLLNAESELGNSVLADEATQKWINSNTRPCPSCSVPISKIDGCNHMSCSHCRAKFCWACLRVNAKCRAFGCMHGAPYGNASPAILGGGEEEGRDEQDMGILDRIGRIESDATNVSITDFVILTSIGIGVCGREDPWVQFVAKMIVSTFCFIFSGGFLSFLLLFFVLCVMFRDTLLRDGRQARQQEWPLNNDHRGGMPLVGMDQINLIMEERMLRQAIRRSLVEQ